MSNRYQDQTLLVRMWRKARWYPTIPFVALGMYVRSRADMPFFMCWKLAKGIAQGKMEWWYSMDEVMERMRARTKERL